MIYAQHCTISFICVIYNIYKPAACNIGNFYKRQYKNIFIFRFLYFLVHFDLSMHMGEIIKYNILCKQNTMYLSDYLLLINCFSRLYCILLSSRVLVSKMFLIRCNICWHDGTGSMGEYSDDQTVQDGSLDFSNICWYLFALHLCVYNILSSRCFFNQYPKNISRLHGKNYSNFTRRYSTAYAHRKLFTGNVDARIRLIVL